MLQTSSANHSLGATANRTTAVSRLPGGLMFPKLFEVLLVFLYAGLTLNDKLLAWMAPVDRWVGIALVLMAVASMSRVRGSLKIEVILFVLFVVWSTVTGLLVASDQSALIYYVRLLAQEAALFLAIAEYTRSTRSSGFVFGLLFFTALGIVVYQAAVGGTAGVQTGEGFRASAVYTNPNATRIACVLGLFGAAYLLPNPKSTRLRLWPALAIPVLLLLQVRTGARLTFVAFFVFVLAWLTLCFRGAAGVRTRVLFWAGMALLFISQVANTTLRDSVLSRRLRTTVAAPGQDSRVQLYALSWEAFVHSPLVGVGLGNFAIKYGSGAYTHSDYMEVLSSTGVVGFLLYFAIYLLLWRRLSRCQRRNRDATTRYRIGLYKAVILTMLCIAVGAPNMFIPNAWILLGAIVGHSSAIERSVAKLPKPDQPPRAYALARAKPARS
jgi:O-antigen ligase